MAQEHVLTQKDRLLTTRQLANQERQATTRPVTEGLNAIPLSNAEKDDCNRRLSPQVQQYKYYIYIIRRTHYKKM